MDCGDVRVQLHELRRGRLDPAMRAEVRRHLADCEPCRRAEEVEGALDEALQRKLPRHAAPEALRRRLAWGAGPGAPPPRRAARRWASLLAPALALGLAAAAAALLFQDRAGRQAATDARLVGEAVNDHLRLLASQRPLEVESGGVHQVKPWFEGKLDFAPEVPLPGVADLRLRGGAVGYVLDRKAAVIQYALRLHAVTLLAFPADGLAWPAPNAALGSIPARTDGARGFHVVLWRARPTGYALVSDVNTRELLDLARSMAPATMP